MLRVRIVPVNASRPCGVAGSNPAGVDLSKHVCATALGVDVHNMHG